MLVFISGSFDAGKTTVLFELERMGICCIAV